MSVFSPIKMTGLCWFSASWAGDRCELLITMSDQEIQGLAVLQDLRDQAIIQVWLNDQSSSQINTDKRLSSTVFCHLYFSSMTKIRRDNFKITKTSLFSATYFELLYSCVITQRDEPFGLFSIGNYFTTASTSLSMACMPPRLSLIKYQVLESRKTI